MTESPERCIGDFEPIGSMDFGLRWSDTLRDMLALEVFRDRMRGWKSDSYSVLPSESLASRLVAVDAAGDY